VSLDATSYLESWEAVPDSVPTARRAVVEWLRAANTTDPPLGEIEVVVSEALANAVTHAYRDDGDGDGEGDDRPGEMRVRIELHPREVEVVVEDDGLGMIPRADSPGLGLGLPLIAMLSDRLDVQSAPGGGTRLAVMFARRPLR
jgi:serine/threonine-protein kinase RsbW